VGQHTGLGLGSATHHRPKLTFVWPTNSGRWFEQDAWKRSEEQRYGFTKHGGLEQAAGQFQCRCARPRFHSWVRRMPTSIRPSQCNMDQPRARSSDATLTQGVIRRTRTSKYSSARCTARAPDATLRGATRSPKMLLCWRWMCLAPLLVEPRGLISCLSSAEQRC